MRTFQTINSGVRLTYQGFNRRFDSCPIAVVVVEGDPEIWALDSDLAIDGEDQNSNGITYKDSVKELKRYYTEQFGRDVEVHVYCRLT